MSQPRIAFLPVLTKARELEARVLLAAMLARQGFRVVLGHKSFVDYRARFARNALYFCPSLIPVAEERLRAFKARGHRIIGWDEEGLVYPDPHWYFSNRVGEGPARLCDVLIAWGGVCARDWEQTLPADAASPLPLGNGRIDLLREPFRRLHADEAERLRARFGRYILVNTNFDMVNHNDGPGALLQKMKASGRLAGEHDRARFAAWEQFRQAMFDAFMSGLPQLHEALPDVNFVLRPHPSESPLPYRRLAQSLPRLFVEPPAGTVLPWILGAAATLHNSCTTAVESFMLDVPPIAYEPDQGGEGMESPLPNLLSIRAPDWTAVAERLRMVLDDAGADWRSPEQQAAVLDYIGSAQGPVSSERIAAMASEMVRDMPSSAMGGPDPARKLRRAAGALAERLGLRTLHSGADDLRRFPGLGRAELEDLAMRIGQLAGVRLRVVPFERDTFIIENAEVAA